MKEDAPRLKKQIDEFRAVLAKSKEKALVETKKYVARKHSAMQHRYSLKP